jgi:hypothetical protein
MPSPLPPASPEGADRYHGFALASVGWGDRERFRRRIESLFERGLIGPERSAVTATFFGLLRQADQGSYDLVLRHFLGALNPRTEWLLEVPAVFAAVVDLGRDLAASQPHRGVVFFTILAEEGLGQTPEQVRQALALARRVRQVDADLSLAFLKACAGLAQRLAPADLERFVDVGLTTFARNPVTGLAFMQGTLASAAALVRALAQECRLQDIQDSLAALTQALAGHPLQVADLGGLPSDDVAGRGCRCVLLERTLYLPARVRSAPLRERNRGAYTLAAVVAAGTLRFDSFSRIHGHPRYRSLRGLVGDSPLALNALLLAEWHRMLSGCCQHWPGVRRLLQAGLVQNLAPGAGEAPMPAVVSQFLLSTATAVPAPVPAGCASADADHRSARAECGDVPIGVGTYVCGPAPGSLAAGVPAPLARLAQAAQACLNIFHTAALLTPTLLAELRETCPELALEPLPPLSFMPDFLFPAREAILPTESVVMELQRAATTALRPSLETTAVAESTPPSGQREEAPPEAPSPTETAVPTAVAYVYDEWSNTEHDYRRGHCRVHETIPTATPDLEPPADTGAEARRVRRAFERLKPDAVRRERYLREGDEINVDRLVNFVTQRGADPSPRVDFYEKPRVSRRDLAVLLLLDLSGSTAELTPGGERILDLERRAAVVLGQGLEALGDRFAVCGFNSNGPLECNFVVFKDFKEHLQRGTVARLGAAVPAHRTRIGPALRHAGWRLSRVPCRQRLILLITDGRPLDAGYEPGTHYAHDDVRKAGEENARHGIHTFAISTAENSAAEMGVMFPDHRFVILPDVRQLPRILPAVYTRLTR